MKGDMRREERRSGRPSGSTSRRSRKSRLRRVLPAVVVVSCLLSLCVGWLGLRGWQTHNHLLNAASLARELGNQVLAGQTAQAQHTLAALQRHTTAARAGIGDPVWRGASKLPYGGQDLEVIRSIALTVDDLARQVVPGLLAADLAAVLPADGRVDVAALRRAAPVIADTDTALRQTRERFDARPSDARSPRIRAVVTQLRAQLDRMAELTAVARQGVALLPPLFGADGPRTYLLVFQNLAELRATGGMFGAYALIKVDRGHLEIVRQGQASELPTSTEPVLPLDRYTRALYTDLIGRFPADVNLTPHFPTAAALYREFYRRESGTEVDGVLATDPVALSYLLRVLGPVAVPDGPTLRAETVVRTLLSDVYQQWDPGRQDRYFAVAAKAVFGALTKRSMSPRALLDVLGRAVDERRILFWSAHPDEQANLVNTRLSGVLPEQETSPTVGVFLNDGGGSKLAYHLTNAAELTVGRCLDDGRRELRLRVTLASTAPTSGLAPAVLGLGMGTDPYHVRLNVYVFGPVGGAPESARLDGQEIPLGAGVERGRRVGITAIEVAPGQSRVLEVTLLTPAASAGGGGQLWLTPTVTPWTTQIHTAPSCAR